ncbi:MAG: ribosomal RNA small subunit methyltransferase A [Candidatus Omnitrophica bacterium CG11_big_fil_rev_8_21_14_0_20_42_13]|uniref:Ribosomal RNA small subunit methyltransferase A n=1 Tax=Candidatus Ghiorseimicrobium undicola TaxID=1974746 RepID=A0A2H0LVG4_9BACT|nr:MAG: ribosomal RNA small subunit methyltransferase A [Candidatus Omnitrophica bacterium CG11_big_fil_rev_8_21_14_0_20_42_13]
MKPDFKPKKHLGQNFLFDRNILGKIAASIKLKGNDTVLEIGPGLGTLTDFLAKEAEEVIAVEVDRRAVSLLKDKFRDSSNVRIVNCDFLKYSIPGKYSGKKIKVVGNIPYYITTPIIEHLIDLRKNIEDIFITVQKELAQRIIAPAASESYGSLSCFVQYYFKPEILFKIKPGSFWPAPKVESVLLRLSPYKEPPLKVRNEKLLFTIIRNSFAKRRKTIINALSFILDKELISSIIRDLGLKHDVRAEELSLKQMAEISESIERLVPYGLRANF